MKKEERYSSPQFFIVALSTCSAIRASSNNPALTANQQQSRSIYYISLPILYYETKIVILWMVVCALIHLFIYYISLPIWTNHIMKPTLQYFGWLSAYQIPVHSQKLTNMFQRMILKPSRMLAK